MLQHAVKTKRRRPLSISSTDVGRQNRPVAGGSSPGAALLTLQRAVGNRAVQRLCDGRAAVQVLPRGQSPGLMRTERIQRQEEDKPCNVHVYDNSNPKDTAVVPKDGSGIGVSSVSDMVSKVNAYVGRLPSCDCVARLEINGHGADGNQSVGAGLGNDADKILDADSKDAHLKQLASIKFCPTGLFMLLGCHVGRSRGKKLLSRLAGILPGKLIGGAKHYTAGKGMGNTRVTGKGDAPNTPYSKRDPFLTSPYVRWHIVLDGKEYIINGDETTSTEGKTKLKKAKKIKVVLPDGAVRKIK